MKIEIVFEVDTNDEPELWDSKHETGMSNEGHETLLLMLGDIVGPVVSVRKIG